MKQETDVNFLNKTSPYPSNKSTKRKANYDHGGYKRSIVSKHDKAIMKQLNGAKTSYETASEEIDQLITQKSENWNRILTEKELFEKGAEILQPAPPVSMQQLLCNLFQESQRDETLTCCVCDEFQVK